MKENYILLKSIDQYLDNKGNLYNITKNGNVDDSEIIKNIINVSGVWWTSLSPTDYDVVETIWRTLWEK
jgi:hypothetical protein